MDVAREENAVKKDPHVRGEEKHWKNYAGRQILFFFLQSEKC